MEYLTRGKAQRMLPPTGKQKIHSHLQVTGFEIPERVE
jgi:hypothetical protein